MKTILAILLSAAAVDFAHAATTALDRAWIERCMTQLASEHDDKKAVLIYCGCMHGYFEDNDEVTQNEMEHMFPPAHRLCHTKAGWK
jgi:hypothetical protein